MARARWLAALFAIGILSLVGLAGQPAARVWLRTQQLLRFAPDLNRDLARHVVSDSDQEWLDHCRNVGTAPLVGAFAVLGAELRTPSYARFLERRPSLELA